MDDAAGDVSFAQVQLHGGEFSLEYQWISHERSGISHQRSGIARERAHAPLLVFLHEGLGSVALWRDWPQQVRCGRLSRPGVLAARLWALDAAAAR